jgi:hypothetical protein
MNQALDPDAFGYPKMGSAQAAAWGPGESIINLKHRLILAEIGSNGNWSAELSKHAEQNLETLLALQPYLKKATWEQPPFQLDQDEEREFERAVTSFFSFHRNDVETWLGTFGFLELFSRGVPERRRGIASLLPDELEVYRRYLLDFDSFTAEELCPKPPAVEDPDRAFQEWILPNLRGRAGVTDSELNVLKDKLDHFESLIHALKGFPADNPSEAARELSISVLLHNRAIDPEDPIPDGLRLKLEETYDVKLSVVTCKRCRVGHRPSAMKTSDICWGCWDG